MNDEEKIEFVKDILKQVMNYPKKDKKIEDWFDVGTKIGGDFVVVFPGYINGPNRAISYNPKTGEIDIAT